jgi:RNA polymerase sigma-70 factor (ECF subfamily)
VKVSSHKVKLSAHTAVLPSLQTHAQFEEIVHEHQAMVFRTLFRLTGDRQQVDDLAQEVFLRLYRGLDSFRGQSKISTYLYRIVVNVAQDAWKRRRKERALIATPFFEQDEPGPDPMESFADFGPGAEEQLLQQEFWQTVDCELLLLSDHERAVLVLYHQEERSYEAIAEILHMPVGTVRTHLHRGRQRLGEAVRNRIRPNIRPLEVATR